MLGLLQKDLYMFKRYKKSLFVLFLFYIVWGITTNDPSFIGYMFTFIFSIFTLSSFSYDELAKWDSFAFAMPISRNDLVKSKYIFASISAILGSILGFVYILVLSKVKSLTLPKETFYTVPVVFCVVIIFLSILLPITFKYGVEKSRYAMFAIAIIPALIVAGMNYINIPKPSQTILNQLEQYVPYALAIITILAFILSYFVSVSIVKKKEY